MKILFNTSFDLSPDERVAISQRLPGSTVEQFCEPDPDALDGAGVEVIVSDRIPRGLDRWPDLQWVQLISAGSNHLKGHPVWETSINVTNASGIHAVVIAQYVTFTWLMMVHRMPSLLEFKQTRRWPDRPSLGNRAVRGMTVGLIGYGSIGRECARQLNHLGMRVLCLKRDPWERIFRGYNPFAGTGDPEGEIPEGWYASDQLGELLPQCDLVVVTVPGTPQTEGMMGAAELALMKPEARLIVISRGGIVEETALADALREGRLKEAVVDCYVEEPLPEDHAFFEVPNLIMTPHVSGMLSAYWPMLHDLLHRNLRRYAAGVPLLNEVNRDLGY
ncbi:MAG: D-2-hydroxyacid dehydrogenase [Opitutaceae bacterium]|nr:D-2-hydroxyacid dehydrogenase [Cephaloticoccus sp.]MCP5530420.1 D-2-hydroxyacid dehydrogenase [Opitutaceae bacterium]